MERLKGVVGTLLVLFVLGSCSSDSKSVRGAVLPHHNLVGGYIDEFYSEIVDDSVERVILISPNHYDLGHAFIQSAHEIDTDLELDKDFIGKLENEKILYVEPIGFEREHGVMVHVDRLEKYFPDAVLVPIMIKWKTPEENLDRLVRAIFDEENMDTTLVIASIDFSHFVDEETAKKNDNRTIEWFEDWGAGKITDISLDEFWKLEKSFEMDTDVATALDSPETFYVFTELIGDPDKVELWRRTSSASMYGIKDPLQNTSHLFVKVW